MALPAILGVLALVNQVASAITGSIGQNQQAEKNRKAAEEAYRNKSLALSLRQHQEREATAQSVLATDRQARSADALARVSAGAAGVGGASVDMITDDIERQRLLYGTRASRNEAMALQQLEMEKVGAKAERDNRINQVPESSPFLLGLRIGGAALNTGADYLNQLPPSGKK